ncbi:MAG: CoA transferase, partial [Povalibacter sp.]
VADMMNDAHFNARGLFEQVEIDGAPLKVPAILPKLESTPGSTQWPGPKLGEHTDEVLSTLIGLTHEQIGELRKAHVIK